MLMYHFVILSHYLCSSSALQSIYIAFSGVSLCLSVCLSVCLSPCFSICLSVCMTVCLSLCLSVSCLKETENCPCLGKPLVRFYWCNFIWDRRLFVFVCMVYQHVCHCHYVHLNVGFTNVCVTVLMSVCSVHRHACHCHDVYV